MNRLLNLKGWQEAKMPWAHASAWSSAASGLTAGFHSGKHRPLPQLCLLDQRAPAQGLWGSQSACTSPHAPKLDRGGQAQGCSEQRFPRQTTSEGHRDQVPWEGCPIAGWEVEQVGQHNITTSLGALGVWALRLRGAGPQDPLPQHKMGRREQRQW